MELFATIDWIVNKIQMQIFETIFLPDLWETITE